VKRRVVQTISVIVLSAIVMAFGGCASSRHRYRYQDDYYDRGSGQQAHAYGYQNGYSDGYRKGQHEGRENDPGDINVRALEQATHGYRSWMGPIDSFQDGYRDGYRHGFRKGYEATNRKWGDGGYDDDWKISNDCAILRCQ
jgi:flagellar biosynthesis/type III secretory pathway protein FliH